MKYALCVGHPESDGSVNWIQLTRFTESVSWLRELAALRLEFSNSSQYKIESEDGSHCLDIHLAEEV